MRRAGFTIIELIAIIIAIVLIIFILLPAIGRRGDIRPLKDATQLRGIQEALVTWAAGNDGQYPLPSAVDSDNYTVPEIGRAKDTTANIMSLLIIEGFVTAELLVSPVENNNSVHVYEDYEIENIADAVNPEKALWDPKLSADFTAEQGGNISYAHLIPQGKRLDKWNTPFNSQEAILSNRGPEIRSVDQDKGEVITHFTNPRTVTTRLFTSSTYKNNENWWSGNIAYNDNHVVYGQHMYADNKPVGQPDINPRLKLPQADGSTLDIHDVLFADERPPEGEDAQREAYDANQFLGIFTTAGENREDFTAIWD